MKLSRLKHLLCAAFVGSTVLWGEYVEAGVVTQYVPMLTYADHTVPTYNKPNGSQKGFISPNVALVWIKEIRPDGWAYGSYPIAGGKRIYRWFRMQELQGYNDYNNFHMRSDATQIVFRTSSQDAKIGKLLYDEDILVVGETGANYKIIYKVNGGSEYKMGWIEKQYGSRGSGENGSSEDRSPVAADYSYDDGASGNDDQSGEAGVYGEGRAHKHPPRSSPGGERSGGSRGNRQVVVNYGTIVSNGDTDFSFNDGSVTDNSVNNDNRTDNSVNTDNSKNTTYDESRNDNRVTNDNHVDNSTNVDNSENTTNVNKNTNVNQRSKDEQ